MVTTGVIKSINISDENHLNYKYIVDLPIFNFPGQIDKNMTLYTATCSLPGGLYSSYKEGDKVYVSFINNDLSTPVILGKIYQGLTEENRTYAYLDTLKVAKKVELPIETKIGELTYTDLEQLKTIDRFKIDIVNLTHPIGSIYTCDPTLKLEDLQSLFPGTKDWSKLNSSTLIAYWKRIS